MRSRLEGNLQNVAHVQVLILSIAIAKRESSWNRYDRRIRQ